MRALVLASLLLPFPAFAGTHLDKFDARAGLVQVSGVGEVPLYEINDSAVLLVRAKVAADREALFAVSLAGADYQISEDLAKELKLKVKSANKRPLNIQGEDAKWKEGGEIKLATLATLDLGTLHIEDLQVTVSSKLGKIDGHPIEGVIGLAAFDNQLAWALVRSKGVLKVGPSSAGAELVGALGGQALSYEGVARAKYKDKVRGLEVKGTTDRVDFIVPAALGGQPVKANLDTFRETCSASPALNVGAAPERSEGDLLSTWLSPTVAGASGSPQWFERNGAYTLQLAPEPPAQATLCLGVLDAFDIAVDPVARKIGLAEAKDQRVELSDTLLAEAVARAEKKPEAPAADAKDNKDASPPKPDAKPYKALYAIQMAKGAYGDAAASAAKLTEIDARDCAGWQMLADAQAGSGLFTDAIQSYTRSSELYHAWWDLSLEEREKAQKALDKLKTDAEKEQAAHKVQPSGCFTTDGDLALLALATGDLARVQTLYKERLDLDPDVALAAGNAALRQGRFEEAHGPYRQAIKRETLGKPDLHARQGVALANLKAENWSAAEPAFQGVFERGSAGLLEASAYLDGVRAARGPEAALLVAKGLAESRPDLLATQVLWFQEATRGGDADAVAPAQAAVEKVAYTALNRFETRADRCAIYAWYLALAGKPDEAVKIAGEGIALKNDLALAWLTLARVAASAGDTANAAQLEAKAFAFGARSPGFALLAGASK